MNKQRIKIIILDIFVICTVAFIFIQSLQNMHDSSSESRWMMEMLRPVLAPLVGTGNFTEILVRKLAHFTEFALLGAELAGLLAAWGRVRAQGIINISFMAIGTALLDETIQILSGRGPAIADVWIDTAGAAFGIMIVMVIRAVIRAAGRRHAKRV